MEGSFSENTVNRYRYDNIGSEKDLFTWGKNQSGKTGLNEGGLKKIIKWLGKLNCDRKFSLLGKIFCRYLIHCFLYSQLISY